ncbi:MAG: tRNA lysidine(34) synthetase TilS [Anaerolineaceae bacterium]|nr:tRNA lysidine(34) synthetase TilS [Anaerolineaceae bacterium]
MSDRNSLDTLENELKRAVERQLHSLAGIRVVLAVSGGNDSLVLMHLCGRWREHWQTEFTVATLDHGIRGQAGERDLDHVIQLADEWGLTCVARSVDAKGMAARAKKNVEEMARKLRYEFLVDIAKEINAAAIFAAHHKNDQVETVLAQLIRGSGIHGMSGMREKRTIHERPLIHLIRPFLSFTRQQLLAYAAHYGIKPRPDETNQDLRYTRNRLRHHTIPHMKEFNPQIETAIFRTAAIAAETADYLLSQAADFIDQHGISKKHSLQIPRQPFLAQHRTMQREILRLAHRRLQEHPSPYHLTLSMALEQIQTGKGEKRQPLSKNVQLRLGYKSFYVERLDFRHEVLWDDQPFLPEHCQLALVFPGWQHIPHSHWAIELTHSSRVGGGQIVLPHHLELTLRTRQKGDHFAPHGMQGKRKSLKRWLIDRKIPRSLRYKLPLIAHEDEILAVYWEKQWWVSEPHQPTIGNAKNTYRIAWHPLK